MTSRMICKPLSRSVTSTSSPQNSTVFAFFHLRAAACGLTEPFFLQSGLQRTFETLAALDGLNVSGNANVKKKWAALLNGAVQPFGSHRAGYRFPFGSAALGSSGLLGSHCQSSSLIENLHCAAISAIR